MPNPTDSIRAIRWQQDHLSLLDQRVLPATEQYLDYVDAPAVADAIRSMVVRGAPAIGITAAYAVVLSVRQHIDAAGQGWRDKVAADIACLSGSRPTAVNLFWALERMQSVLQKVTQQQAAETLLQEARAIHDADIAANFAMAEFGSGLLSDCAPVLTHCNTGSLATGGYGTALGVIRSAYREGKISQVYADETRPWLQGARLTAWELVKDNIPVKLIAEGAAASLMRSEKPAWVIVGADRIAANGDVANKIGTYSLAVLARQHGVKFMVVAPTSTIDLSIANGGAIPIEFRNEQELMQLNGVRIASEGASAWNPVFDVTPAELIDVIVTELGIVTRPDISQIHELLNIKSA